MLILIGYMNYVLVLALEALLIYVASTGVITGTPANFSGLPPGRFPLRLVEYPPLRVTSGAGDNLVIFTSYKRIITWHLEN